MTSSSESISQEALKHNRAQIRASEVDRGGVASRTRSDNDLHDGKGSRINQSATYISGLKNKKAGTDDFGVQLGALHVGLCDRMGIDGGGVGRSGVWIRVVVSVNKFRGSDKAGW